MPFIHTMTNTTVSKEKEELLRRQLGKAIEILPGKSERWLMLALSDGCRMAFHADADSAMAMVEVSLYGQASDDAKGALTAALTDILHDVLDIHPSYVYVKYTETNDWGYNGENF